MVGDLILATSSKSSSTGSTSFLPILLIIVVMIAIYYMMSRRSRQRQAAQMNTNLVPGQPARTTGGMYGTISSVEGDDITLEVSPGVHIRMMKRAVVPMASGGPSMNGTRTETAADNADSADDVSDSADNDSPKDRKL